MLYKSILVDQFYCLIKLEESKLISVYVFSINKTIKAYDYPICFTANSSKLLYILLSYYSLCNLFSCKHLLYLGKEIYKANIAITLGQNYVQD